MARPSYEMHEHSKEVLRYAWANESFCIEFPGTICSDPRPKPSIYREPIRPYDDAIDYDLYLIADMAPADTSVNNSKPMGGFAVMFSGGPLEWKSHRFHTIVPDVASGETIEASRVAQRGVFYRRLCNFFDRPRSGPTNLFTDNDGTWYAAREATGTTRMNYVINHLRIVQQLERDKETRAFQIDTVLNFSDPLTKWLPSGARWRHYNFMAGRPQLAKQLWRESNEYKQWKPKKIVPVPSEPIELAVDVAPKP